jgi:hypothetical protein
MKKVLILLAAVVLVASCSSKKPVELQIPKENVELTGNGFQVFSPGADLKLVMAQNPDNADEWMICGSVPMVKVSEAALGETALTVNLLDENGLKVREGFVLVAEGLGELLPSFNADKNVEKTLVFSPGEESRKYFTYKEAADMLARTKSVSMNVNVVESKPVVAAGAEKKGEPVTVNSLLEKYGVYGLLSQYDRALKNKEKKKAKGIEDKLYDICKKVKADPTVPESVSKRFRDYIEDKEDEIEKKY